MKVSLSKSMSANSIDEFACAIIEADARKEFDISQVEYFPLLYRHPLFDHWLR